MFAMYELRMNRPCAREGLPPISSRVRPADDEPEPELGGGGGGEPDSVEGTRCMGGSGCTCATGPPAAAPTGIWAAGAADAGGAVLVIARSAPREAGGEVAGTPDPARRRRRLAIRGSKARPLWGPSVRALAS